MSKYTTEVRFICETAHGLQDSTGYRSVNEIISDAIHKVFDFDFPIFDEKYRNVLCGKILKHYYTREICEETVALWKLRLDARMNEIMPYYNQLYKSELIEFNPLYDTDITRTSNKGNTNSGNTETDSTNDVTSSGTSTSKATGSNNVITESTGNTTDSGTNKIDTSNEKTGEKVERDLYSDTPQGGLDGVENETYLTNARKKIGEENNTETGTSTGTSSSESNTTNSGTANTTTTDDVAGTTSSTTGQVSNSVTNFTNESTEDYLETVLGKQGSGSYSKLLMEYRQTFVNIDMQVINELSDLFMNLW